MAYKLEALIAFCQREGILSTDSYEVCEELAEIWDCSASEVEELLD